jgi:hypothetical protein
MQNPCPQNPCPQNPCPVRRHRPCTPRSWVHPSTPPLGIPRLSKYDCAMTLREKILFHQVHPAKLATDVASAFVSLYFLWQHALLIGLIAHVVPPPVGSAIVMACADLEPYKNSRLGTYLVRYMRPGAQAARLVGDLIMVLAAWFRSPGGIAVGLLIVVAAWSHGLICLLRN